MHHWHTWLCIVVEQIVLGKHCRPRITDYDKQLPNSVMHSTINHPIVAGFQEFDTCPGNETKFQGNSVLNNNVYKPCS